MERVAVIGTSGSGKTTLARRLASALDAPHLEIDSIYIQAGWQRLDVEELRRRVAVFCAGPRWVTCGTYSEVRDLYLARADTVVCLDHNRVRQTLRVHGRTLRRAVARQELWNGNREPVRGVWPIGPADKVLARYAWESIPRTRARFDDLQAHPPHDGLTVVRLRGWRTIDAFLWDVERAGGVDRN